MAIEGLTEEEFTRLDILKRRLGVALQALEQANPQGARENIEFAINEIEDLMGPGAM